MTRLFARRLLVHRCLATSGQRPEPSRTRRSAKTPRPRSDLRELFPEGKVLERGYHRVSSYHQIYYEVHGNPEGIPAVVLHGGPGAGCSPAMGRLFDLDVWKVVLFDQRGCGKSVPPALLYSNTMRKLVGDIEKLRYHLQIKRWLVFGGSHGSALALCYAQEHTSRVTGLVLRAVCLMRPQEIAWLFSRTGAATHIPKGWQRFMSILEPNEQKNPIKAYYSRMLSLNDDIRTQAARYWREWTMTVMFSRLPQFDQDKIQVKPETLFAKPRNMNGNINLYWNRTLVNAMEEVKPLPSSVIQSLIESHFFYNNKRFMTDVYPLLDLVYQLHDVPCIAIHGEEDQLCLMTNAHDLKRKWKSLDLRFIPGAGHSQFDSLILDATIRAIEDMKAVSEEEILQEEFHDSAPLPIYQIPEPHYKKKYR